MTYTWSFWQANIGAHMLQRPSEMLCFAARWLDEETCQFYSVNGVGKDAMILAMHSLLDACDVLITYNGKKFDVPHMNREMLLAGLTPPSPYKQIDLYQAVKSRFKFTHNGLDAVCGFLGLEQKIKHDGFDLWVKCMANDADAWQQMREYNIGDVNIMVALYYKLLPWIANLPSYSAFTGEIVCPGCGSYDLRNRGFAYTPTMKYQRVRCHDCGKWSRFNKAETKVSQIPASG